MSVENGPDDDGWRRLEKKAWFVFMIGLAIGCLLLIAAGAMVDLWYAR